MKQLTLLALSVLLACAHGPNGNKKGSLTTIDGQPFALEQLNGKVVLLDFWATWCEPCKATLPATQRLADKLGPRGLITYVVNVEKASTEVILFLKDLKIALPVLRDPDGVQAEQLGGSNLPFAVLLDKNGKVRFHHEGLGDKLEEQLNAEAEQLISEAP